METGYQRGKIQEESLEYERKKHDGTLPIIGVNLFEDNESPPYKEVELSRGTVEERENQLHRLRKFHTMNDKQVEAELDFLKSAALSGKNVFGQLMSATRYCSLGQITSALFDVGGKYRRNM